MKKFALLMFSLPLLLSAADISQELLNADDLSVGDRFQFNIRADVSLNSVVVPDTITNFHVFKVERKAPIASPAWLQLEIAPLLPGSHSFPSLEVMLDSPDGERYFTDRFRLNIIPVRAAEDTLLVDIKPVEKYPGQLPGWLYVLLLLLLGVLVLLYFLRRKPREEPSPEPNRREAPVPVIPDPAWKEALKKLAELLSQDLLAKGEYISHHYQLSMLLRQFLERKYRFAAGEMTTSEIGWVTERIRVDRSSEVLEFLRYCDKVKFAKYIPTAEEAEQATNWLRSWLQSFEVLEAQAKLASGGAARA